MVRLARVVILISCFLFAGNRALAGTCPSNVPSGVSNCFYADFGAGADTSSGASEATPWKHIPGMTGCSSNCASNTPAGGSGYILKGGSVWSTAAFPMLWKWAGTSSNPIYIGYDPTWNTGTVVSIRPTTSGSNCSAISVALSGGGGASGAGTANFQTANYLAGLLQHITVTNAGSGYTTNPTVSFASSTCTTLPTAVVDIQSPVWDVSGTTWNETNGASPGFGPIYFSGNNYTTIDHLDIRGMAVDHTIAGGSGALFMVSDQNAGNVTWENIYLHNFGPNLLAATSFNGTGGMMINEGYAASTVTFTNGFVDNYEGEQFTTCGLGNFPPPCGSSQGVQGATIFTNNVVHDVRGGIYSPAVAQNLVYTGNLLWDGVWDCCSQHEDTYYFFGGGVLANNVLHDIAPGAAAFYIELSDSVGNCNETYIYNNLIWNIGQSTPPIGHTAEFYNAPCNGSDGVSTPTMYDYNNTMYSLSGTTACINWGQNSGINAADFYLYNNHCISDQSGTHWYGQAGGQPNNYGTANGVACSTNNCANTNATVDPSNTIMSASTATSQGYVVANQFAPTASTNSTVTANGSDFNPCEGNHSTLCIDFNGNQRPSSGPWNTGAYYYTSGNGGQPNPPTGLTAVVN
jgi:hypothetical protein